VHELGITQGIIDRAREAARSEGAARVDFLYLTITPAADFTRESIEMYFAMLTGEDDIFEGATLLWDEAPVNASCLECGAEFSTVAERPACPKCESTQVSFDPSVAMVQLTGVGVDDGEGTHAR